MSARHTPRRPRAVRVEDELWEPSMRKAAKRGDVLSEEIRAFLEVYSSPAWDEAKARADERGEVLSEVIREALRRYVKSKGRGR